MEQSNNRWWKKLSQPPTRALRTIGAGRLKGKTDINPQWRYEAMTELFGPCGIGWRYEVKRTWTEKGYGEEVFAFAEVAVYVKDDTIHSDRASTVQMWSEPIPGIGGHKLVVQESQGVHNNDEAYKMAITDALSVALKMLGVAADVYAGLWDGSKFKEPNQTPDTSEDEAPPELTEEQMRTVDGFSEAINLATTEAELDAVGKKLAAEKEKIPAYYVSKLRGRFTARKNAIKGAK